mgnify:CR=1 FL=1
MILRILFLMLLKELPNLSVRWNLRKDALYIIGVSRRLTGKEKPRQIEFARLNVTTMITSKRKLRKMVESGVVSGWDDPRMPTISGIRRRGYTPESLRRFCELIGVAKAD